MYFVDREKIEEMLTFMDQQLAQIQAYPEISTPLQQAAIERWTHIVIEAILDVGNSMIDGFIMRDPGSYEDIVEILTDEKVITEAMSAELKRIVSYRKMLVQQYTKVDHELILKHFHQHMQTLTSFSTNVREYLTHELGPVSAFRN
ncbi:type VII toxin-antitoxin system HepT family RNase toxin [Bacillus sp. 2205SS5-2]|uniref:type VII toxin-antitoxin system HepT family RNase toxin n=1 Tax=Bacillus sp. 2205SS5-2 TaxID=3109031 RepID=UPI003005D38C